jgi:hypothetical protein
LPRAPSEWPKHERLSPDWTGAVLPDISLAVTPSPALKVSIGWVVQPDDWQTLLDIFNSSQMQSMPFVWCSVSMTMGIVVVGDAKPKVIKYKMHSEVFKLP